MIEQTVLQFLKAILITGEQVELNDWSAVFEEMKKQSVAGLAGDRLKKDPIPGAAEWSLYCAAVMANWIRVMHGQDELLKLLDENGIPSVILKGAAAAMAYPHPSLRSTGDVDFLVKRNDFEKTAELLERNGYVLSHKKDRTIHHYCYNKNSVSFELHHRPGIVRDDDEELLSLFESGIEGREIRSAEGFSFPVLPPALNGLILIFHINQHLRSGLGLRQIIDWMMYIDRLPDTVWNDELLPLLRKTGMEKFALTVTAMCQEYLGLRAIVEDTAAYPCEELMEYIIEKGNMGRKAGILGRTASFSLNATDVNSFFSRLQRGGLARWKAAQRHKALRPFAWIYQMFRIAGVFIKGKISPRQMIREQKKGVQQRELIEALGLKIDRTIQ